MFVTLEGIDRAGKSTQVRLLAEALGPTTVTVREPGGTQLGERVREVLKDPSHTPSPRAEALLFAAARTELVTDVIRPALSSGSSVVCDRFLDSSLAYQGIARGVGVEAVRHMNHLGMGTLVPDLTVLLDLDPEAAASRSGEVDRFEAEGTKLQRRVRDAYLTLASEEPARWEVVDASGDERSIHDHIVRAAMARRGG